MPTQGQPIYPAQVNPPLGYGHDLYLIDDLTADMEETDGRILLAQAIARRLQTPRGSLIDDPNYGYDITGEIDADMSTRDIAQIGSLMDAEALKDERVLSSTTTTTFVAGVLTAIMSLQDKNGPFPLVLQATDVTIDILKVG